MRARRYLWSLMAVLAPIAPACAEMVRDWQNMMHYPARVIAVEWEGGRLDARSSVRFGAWTIRFGTPIHFAHYESSLGYGLRSVGIWGDNPDPKGPIGNNVLRCSNAAVGQRLCTLTLGTDTAWCSLNIWAPSGRMIDTQSINIPCPTALDLAQ